MHSKGRLEPHRFPWTGPGVLFCSVVVAAIYTVVMPRGAGRPLDSPGSFLARIAALAAAFVIPPLLILLVRARGSRDAEIAPRAGSGPGSYLPGAGGSWSWPLGLWVPRAGWPRDVVAGIVLGLLLAFMSGISIRLRIEGEPPRPSSSGHLAWESSGIGDVLTLLLAVGVLAPVAEEVFFRGVLYPWLRKTLSMVPSVLLSSAAFGAAHFDSMRVHAFLLGLVAAILVEYTGSLVPAILAHMGANIGFVMFLANRGVLARIAPLWALAAGFCALNVLLFLLGQPLFGGGGTVGDSVEGESPGRDPEGRSGPC